VPARRSRALPRGISLEITEVSRGLAVYVFKSRSIVSILLLSQLSPLAALAQECAPREASGVPATAGALQAARAAAEKLGPPVDYNQLFPLHVEVCSVRQIVPKEGGAGGPGGHALMYLKGVCRDPQAGYPRLKRCAPGTDLTNPESGTVVSVDKHFKNVNWVAVEGRTMMLTGGMERVSRQNYDALVQQVSAGGAFDGIKYNDEFLKSVTAPSGATMPPAEHVKKAAIEDAVGTDFAINAGRKSSCARIPMSDAQITAMMDYLNGLNDKYASGKADYVWNGYKDNCTHVVHNALAAAGIGKPKKTNAPFYELPFNQQWPENEAFRAAKLVAEDKLEDLAGLYGNDRKREAFLKFGQGPARHGGLLEARAQIADNEMYDPSEKVLFWDVPKLNPRRKAMDRMFGDPRNTDLRVNLEHYEEAYSTALVRLTSDRKVAARMAKDAKFAAFARKYFAWLEAQKQDAAAKRKLLAR
jgi:hypothetical protein